MERNKTIVRLLPVLMVAVFLVGCQKEKAALREAGSEIEFDASTGYKSGFMVRTEYSGSMVKYDGKDYERIDWIPDNDRIRVLCEACPDGPWGDYSISSANASGKNSVASITPCVHYGLHWGEGDHYFYALYPAPGTKSNYGFTDRTVPESKSVIEAVTGNKAKVKGVIPSSQEAYFISSSASGKSFDEYKANMNYAYLAAAKKATTDGSGSVMLSFEPLVTTFEFTICSDPDDPLPAGKKLTKVELQSTKKTLAGSFETVLSQDNTHTTPTAQTDWTGSITLDLGTGVELATDRLVKFTFLTLPVDQTELTLVLYFGDNEFKRSLALKDNGNWLTVPACKKVYISNVGVPSHTLEYHLVHTGTTITLGDASGTQVQEVVLNSGDAGTTGTAPFSTYKTQDGGTTKTPVNISGEYEYAAANADGTPVVNSDNEIVWNTGLPSQLSGLAISTSTANRTFAAGVKANSSPEVEWYISEMLEHARSLQSKTPSTVVKDLSLYDITNLDTPRSSGKPTTANCYVVDRAGTYRFPIVYGNSIDYTRNGAPGTSGTLYVNGVNQYSYYDGSPDANTASQWHRFQGHAGEETLIVTPYILKNVGLSSINDVEAFVVWEDVPSATYSFIRNVQVVNVTSSNLFYDPQSGSYLSSVPYVQFEVPAGSVSSDESKTFSERITGIRQGNAVIAIKHRSSGHILWSWHIWVTDGFDTTGDYRGDGLATVTVKSRESTTRPTNDFLPVNLGWCDDNTYYGYKDRIWYVRIRQAEGNGTPKKLAFKVVQKTPDKTVFHSNGTFYQFGRKDPFLPGMGTESKNKPGYSPAGFTLTGSEVNNLFYSTTPSGDASSGIMNPYIHYLGDNGWMSASVCPINLWNMSARPLLDDDIPVYKTVYDPCPPRFAIPQGLAFTFFTTTGKTVDYWESSSTERPQFNAKDLDGDGKLTTADFNKVNGWYLYADDTKTKTIFFPGTGFREWNPAVGISQYLGGWGSWSWLAAESTPWRNTEGSSTASARVNYNDIDPHPGYTRSYGFPVRPVRE